MPDDDAGSKLHIDSDWKAEAQRDKERLAAEEAAKNATAESLGEASILHLVNMLAMQVMVALGVVQARGAEPLPPDLEMARFHIDLLAVLEQKTAGQLTEEENKVLSATLNELRLMFVQLAGAKK